MSKNLYLLHGNLRAFEGQVEALISILLDASKLVSTAKGCKLYTVGIDPEQKNTVSITEIWESKEDHDNSLKVEGVRELIVKALPLLDGEPTKGQEVEILGGFGSFATPIEE
jgi:quinol monooxygenase YgiN